MNIDVFTTIDEFVAIKDDWTRLYDKDPDASLFLSWRWLRGVFQNNPGQWRVLAARPSETLGEGASPSGYIGFFPIRIKTVWSERRSQFRQEVHAAGSLYWSEYTGFLIDPDKETAVVTAFADQLKSMQWSKCSLKYLRINATRLQSFTQAFEQDHFKITFRERRINDGNVNNLVSPFVALSEDYEQYLTQCVSANTRQRLRRAWRQMQADDSITITASGPATFDEDLNNLLSLWRGRWQAKKGSKTKHLARKFHEILTQGHADGLVQLTVLRIDDKPLCAHACFIDDQRQCMYFLIAGRDETPQKLPIGLLMHSFAIREAINRGYTTYDFLHGDEDYKYSFGCEDRLLHHLVIDYKPGVNLNGGLDPQSIDDVVDATIRFLEQRDFPAALTGCRQLSEFHQK